MLLLRSQVKIVLVAGERGERSLLRSTRTLPKLTRQELPEENLILEPVGRNTTPALLQRADEYRDAGGA